jgi:secondary thiamine-phosphate synthase enzyme
MLIYQQEVELDTEGHGHMQNLTKLMEELVRKSGVHRGLCSIFNQGSTAAIGAVEFEPGLEKDFPAFLDRLVPPGAGYQHKNNWHDDNGHSHIQASLMGPSLTVPVKDGALALGTYQHIVHLECDIKARKRAIMVTIMGE